MRFKTLAVADLPALRRTHDPMLLDCRAVHDYRAGHLAEALHAHDGLVESLIKRGDKQRSLVVYCYHGHSSEHVAELFCAFGFLDVYSLAGGYAAWLMCQQQSQGV